MCAQGCEQQRNGGQALLSVNDELLGYLLADLVVATLDVNDRADEVSGDGRVGCGVADVIPKLLALRERPAISTLVNGDDELLRALQEFEEIRFCGLHAVTPSVLIGTSNASAVSTSLSGCRSSASVSK